MEMSLAVTFDSDFLYDFEDLGAQNFGEMQYNMHNFFVSVQSPKNKICCVSVTLDLAFYVYRDCKSSSTESAMWTCHVSKLNTIDRVFRGHQSLSPMLGRRG